MGRKMDSGVSSFLNSLVKVVNMALQEYTKYSIEFIREKGLHDEYIEFVKSKIDQKPLDKPEKVGQE